MKELQIEKANESDFDLIWPIIKEVISKGDTYAFIPTTSREEMEKYWMGVDKHTFIARDEGQVVGTYILKDNQPGLGSHVCNGSYMVHPKCQGKGIGKALGGDSLFKARELGYKAIQFNLVVSTNEPAVKLWKKLGFNIIGEVPSAFNHSSLGYINAFIMHRFL